ncbi:Protein kinase activator [Penicillium ucsense]|uniref:Protein kinase activator n=1 Tax=Penicillium ucsense TaxID=2839758 RepID=A0A8J8WKH9_9EURO|nr:Protein kinase activator [Penicillium ucsense]KAF7738684.1 Protein kinase activator [Penicillium ucsense]
MATFFQSVRQGFGRGGNNKNNPPKSPAHPPQAPQSPAPSNMPTSPSFPNHAGADNSVANDADAPKYFFQEKYAPLNVRGNFLTLCACPKNVELGEWLAHQIVEQYRLLHGMLQVIQETNSVTGLPICNESTCPTMSAGRLTYTWLVDGRAAKISAPKFINRVEKWIVSKIHDPVMFPTEKVNGIPETASMRDAEAGAPSGNSGATADEWIGQSSGFPQTFYKDCQGIMKQMFRCYAHLYHAHWLNPFWHINKHDILNMCFVHFVTVAKYYQLVSDKEMEPMQPLIDLFIKQQRVPPEALNGGHWAQQPAAA